MINVRSRRRSTKDLLPVGWQDRYHGERETIAKWDLPAIKTSASNLDSFMASRSDPAVLTSETFV